MAVVVSTKAAVPCKNVAAAPVGCQLEISHRLELKASSQVFCRLLAEYLTDLQACALINPQCVFHSAPGIKSRTWVAK